MRKRTVGSVVRNIFIGLTFVYFSFPLFWMFWTSIKPQRYAYDPGKWIFTPSLSGYVEAIRGFRIPLLSLNSVVVAIAASVLGLVVGTLTAYGFVRFKYKRQRASILFFYIVRFIPPVSLVVPLFMLGQLTHLLDTRLILVIVYQIACMTFTILMMKGFLQNVPPDLEEAAMIDGCSRLRAFVSVTLPVVRNGMFATWIFLFLYAWKEFPYALMLTTFRARTLPTAVELFVTTQGVEWNAAMAYAVLATLPILLMAVFMRKHMITGLTFGVSK